MAKKSNIIKIKNLKALRKVMRNIDCATKPQLAEMTGLSVVTINSLVNDLKERDEVRSLEIAQMNVGRPAEVFAYNKMHTLALLIYAHESEGLDTVSYRVIDACGNTIQEFEERDHSINIATLDGHIEDFFKRYPKIELICIGIPGVEVDDTLAIIDYDKIGVDSLSRHILNKYNVEILVENDVNAAVVGYVSLNAVDQSNCIIGLYFPDKYPPGAGIYYEGRVIKGRDGLAGEIKYLPLNMDWDTFDYNKKERDQMILMTIRIFMCVYNPNMIVVYGHELEDYGAILEQELVTNVERMMLPNIRLTHELKRDFGAGLAVLAHKRLEEIINE